MSRATLNEVKALFSGAVETFCTEFSGGASLISPDTGQHLQVFEVRVHGTSDLADLTRVEIRDGTGDPVDDLDVQQGDTKVIDFAGFHWKVDTSLRFTRPIGNEAIRVSVVYRTAPN